MCKKSLNARRERERERDIYIYAYTQVSTYTHIYVCIDAYQYANILERCRWHWVPHII